MTGAIVVLFCVFCLTSTAAQSLDLEQGKVCKEVEGVKWSCKFLKDCPTAQEGLRNRGESPQICSFSGKEAIVCCSPGPAASPPPPNTQPLSSPLPSTTTPPQPSPSPSSTSIKIKQSEVCKEVDGVQWSWKLLEDCPTAQEGLRKRGGSPQICSFSGNETIVCCSPGPEPSASPPPPTSSPGIKSKQMCQKYADAVYIRIPDLMTDDEISYDTCAWREENTTRVKRIAEGSNSLGREFPHMAQIGLQKGEGEIKWTCGGSLISDRFVLSVAHCVGYKNVGTPKWVRVGDYNIKTDADEEMVLAQPTTYRITEVFVHPEYSETVYTNDIVLLKLNDSVFFTEFIRPICLQTEHYLPAGTHAVATGWGRTDLNGNGSDVLRKVNITILSAKECSEFISELIPKRAFAGDINQIYICAKGDHGKNSCAGDSGGPLQMRLKEPYCMYSQVGITSIGRGCGSGYPVGYTRVSHYIPWIESIVWP